MKIAEELETVTWLIDFIIEPLGKLTVLYPPSLMLVVVPDVTLKLFPEPDLSFQTERLEPKEKLILDVVLSAPSNQIPAVTPMFAGVNGTIPGAD
jgi:hypothetical protein